MRFVAPDLRRGATAMLASVLIAACMVAVAEPLLILKAPIGSKQPGEYRLQIPAQGAARIHVQSGASGPGAQQVDFELSTFRADGQPPATLGFVTPGRSGISALVTDIAVPPAGIDLLLTAADLAAGVAYTGQLSATVAGQQTLIWDLTLIQAATVPSILCPHGIQTLMQNAVTLIEFRSAAPLGVTPLSARLSSFLSNDQVLGDVELQGQGGSASPTRDLTAVPAASQHFSLGILGRNLDEAKTYRGTITFLTNGNEVGQCALDVMIPKQAQGTLATDRQSLTRAVMLPFWPTQHRPGHPEATLTASLFDTTHSHSINGIVTTVDGVTEAPNGSFDLESHVSFALNGIPVPDFTQWKAASTDTANSGEPAREARRLLPGEQATLRLDFHDLHAGRYAFALRFAGSDTALPSAKLDVVVTVKQHWLWAVLAVVIALALSVTMTSGVTNWRERMRIRSRAEELRNGVFGVNVSHPSVVFLNAVLEQTNALLDRITILPPPPSVYDHLQRAERVATILTRYGLLNDRIEHLPHLDTIIHFYEGAVEDVMGKIGAQALDQATADGIVKDLDAIDARLSSPLDWYWLSLKERAAVLAQRARSFDGRLGDPAVVDPLIQLLENPPARSTTEFDAAYWMVRLLLSRRNFHPDMEQLIHSFARHRRLQDALEVGDALAWQRVRDAVAKNQVHIRAVDSDANLQSLTPLKFQVVFNDPGLQESYFVRNILLYDWVFKLQREADQERPPADGGAMSLSGGRVTRYAASAGSLAVSLTMRWLASSGTQVEHVPPLRVVIHKNTEISLLHGVNTSNVLMTALVSLVALGTSLPALYLNKPTFGSVADYVAILVWAIGIDQGKNLIQLMKDLPPGTKATG